MHVGHLVQHQRKSPDERRHVLLLGEATRADNEHGVGANPDGRSIGGGDRTELFQRIAVLDEHAATSRVERSIVTDRALGIGHENPRSAKDAAPSKQRPVVQRRCRDRWVVSLGGNPWDPHEVCSRPAEDVHEWQPGLHDGGIEAAKDLDELPEGPRVLRRVVSE
jgi:hypothetical protein